MRNFYKSIFLKLVLSLLIIHFIPAPNLFSASNVIYVAQEAKLLAVQENVNFGSMPLKSAFIEIRKLTGCSFLYNNTLIDETIVVEFKPAGTIESILDSMLQGTDIAYKVIDNQVVLYPVELGSNHSSLNSSELTSNNAVTTQQDKGIRAIGTVLSLEDNEPIPFANVMVKGTLKGVSTDVNGKYILEDISENSILVFSSIGYKTLEVSLNGREVVNAQLEIFTEVLDKVMVVAYGTAKKSTFTGSAAVVGEETFDLRPITEITQALTATTPGVQISAANGEPGSSSSVRIRGLGSFNASNAPLIILDGMPYDNPFSSINPSDVEGITILKDASSAALYGARGANGVLLVNTKKGKRGKPKVAVKYNFGLTSQQSTDYERLGDKDYMELYWERHRNTFMNNGYSKEEANSIAGSALLSGLGYNPYLMNESELFDSNGKLNPKAINHWADDTDWYGAITQLGKRHDANVSISGANENTDYYTSIGYMSEEGFMVGSLFDRISAKGNVNSKITNWLKVGTNITASYSKADGRLRTTTGNPENPFMVSRYMGNVFPIHLHNPSTGEYIYDGNGDKIHDFGNGWASSDGSVVIPGRAAFPNQNHPLQIQNTNKGYIRQTINIKGYVEATLVKGLKLTVNGGLGSNMYRDWNGYYVYEQKGNPGTSFKIISTTATWTFQQLLNYNKSFGKHNFDILAGHESYQYQYHNMGTSMKSQNIPGDNFEYANFSEINSIPTSYTNNYRVEGFLSRLNYDFDEKYFFSASYRRDGSSRFYKDIRWGDFWSVGAGWNIDKEEFMTGVKIVDFLKLRISYGVVGNDDLSSYYPWRAVYAVSNNGEPGYIQSSLGNRNLTWETSRNFDVATEFTLFNNRLDGSLEYFNRESSDLLFSVKQPISSGVTDIDVNAGSMYNRGVEIALNGVVIQKNQLKLSLNGNATFLKNKITDLPMEPYTTSVYKIEEGRSRYEFWRTQWVGVNPESGLNLFKPDVDKYEFGDGDLVEVDGKQYTEDINKAVYEYSGTGLPKITGGFGVNVGWKNFNLLFTFYYQLGGTFYSNVYRTLMSGSDEYYKQHADLVDRWKEPGDVTNVAKVTSGSNIANIEASTSTRWLFSSNMLELVNVNLSYTIPKKILQPRKINSATIYFSADNSLLFTAKRGLYPRRNMTAGSINNPDVFAPSSVFSFGLSLTF